MNYCYCCAPILRFFNGLADGVRRTIADLNEMLSVRSIDQRGLAKQAAQIGCRSVADRRSTKGRSHCCRSWDTLCSFAVCLTKINQESKLVWDGLVFITISETINEKKIVKNIYYYAFMLLIYLY